MLVNGSGDDLRYNAPFYAGGCVPHHHPLYDFPFGLLERQFISPSPHQQLYFSSELLQESSGMVGGFGASPMEQRPCFEPHVLSDLPAAAEEISDSTASSDSFTPPPPQWAADEFSDPLCFQSAVYASSPPAPSPASGTPPSGPISARRTKADDVQYLLDASKLPPEYQYKFDARITVAVKGDRGGRNTAEFLCSFPGVSWNTRMQSWLVYYEDMGGRRSKTFNPKRFTPDKLQDEMYEPLKHMDAMHIAMHCACAFAAEVRYKARLYKSFGFKIARLPKKKRGRTQLHQQQSREPTEPARKRRSQARAPSGPQCDTKARLLVSTIGCTAEEDVGSSTCGLMDTTLLGQSHSPVGGPRCTSNSPAATDSWETILRHAAGATGTAASSPWFAPTTLSYNNNGADAPGRACCGMENNRHENDGRPSHALQQTL